MASTKDKAGRPIVVVTGLGVVTSLGAGKTDNWAKLTAGESGIRAITRFPTDGLKTRIAGTVDFLGPQPMLGDACRSGLPNSPRKRRSSESGIGAKGDFPGPLFLAVPPIEIEWPQRLEISKRSGANDTVTYDDLLRASGEFPDYHERFMFGSVADHLADVFGTKGSPISLSTACASGASAIQLGVEAIRRGETDAALCIGTDGSINPEAVIRFSLLSALSTSNDPPQGAAKPFAKNRDGFVMAEGAGAVVLESYEAAKARGAKIIGVLEGCGEMADSFHRTRSSPDGKPIIGCIANAIKDAGLTPADIDYVNAARHRHAGKRQDGISRRLHRVRRAHEERADLVEQVDDRPHAVGGRRGRGGVLAADVAAPAHSADHQLQRPRSGDPARRGAEQGARRQSAPRHFQLLRLRRAERLAGDGAGAGRRMIRSGTGFGRSCA